MKDSLTELRVICAIADKCGKLMSQPCGHMIHWNHSWKFETVILKWVVMEV